MSAPEPSVVSLPPEVADLLAAALAEDLGVAGDITTAWSLDGRGPASVGTIRAKATGRLSGLAVAHASFLAVDSDLDVELRRADGDAVEPGDVVLVARGPAASLLEAERTALNFLGRLSGVATLTARFVEAVAGTRAAIVDTRKTTPGWRLLEKHAVLHGGGANHRIGLWDEVLLKENHFAFAGAGHAQLVRQARERGGPDVRITAEAMDLEQALAIADGGADCVLLDNFTPEQLDAAVVAFAGHPRRGALQLEASGGVDLGTVARVAASGVDRISVGALTHSAPALDLSMLVERAS